MKEGQKWIDLPAGVTNQIAKDFGVTKRYVLMALDYTRNGKKAKMLRQVALQRGGQVLMASKVSFNVDYKYEEFGKVESLTFTIGDESYILYPSDVRPSIMLAYMLGEIFTSQISKNKNQ